jgi:transporter family-2 protein
MNYIITGSIAALILALISGVAMAVQGGINSALGKIIGLLEATFVVHFTAAVFVGIMLFILNMGDNGFAKISNVPWYLWPGGMIGVLITYGVVASIPKVGASAATTAIIVGQVTTAVFIDYIGLFGLEKFSISWVKFLGVGLLALGARLMLIK